MLFSVMYVLFSIMYVIQYNVYVIQYNVCVIQHNVYVIRCKCALGITQNAECSTKNILKEVSEIKISAFLNSFVFFGIVPQCLYICRVIRIYSW